MQGHTSDVHEGSVYGKEKSNQSRKTIQAMYLLDKHGQCGLFFSFLYKKRSKENPVIEFLHRTDTTVGM